MSFRFLPDGSVIADTADEAIAFHYGKSRPTRPRKAKKKPKIVTKTGWEGFCQRLAGPHEARARKVLALVKGRGEPGITVAELAADTSFTANEVTGLLAGLLMKAQAAGLDRDDVIVRKSAGVFAGRLLLENDPPTP